ncbi:MAG: manganese-dependent inorganic pyrophosphatase [Actinomycetes bacterium]|nr:manganese-dependent inorganic pyrophosphatase [Actinomycetes bacterium]
MTKVYVFGHRNPDNDSICSAAAYAAFLAADDDMPKDGGDEYIAARLGEVPPETAWLFDWLGATDKLPIPLPEVEVADDDEALTVILVDHNEVAQSAPGIDDMNIVGIVDHHRIGDIQTAAPISFVNLPYGSTATIIAQRYLDTETPMPRWVAGVLLAALLTDTVILKSPTTTEVDIETCELLAEALEIDAAEFGMTLFNKRSEATPFEAAVILTRDLKEYTKDGMVIGIVQYENVNLDAVNEHRSALVASMKQIALSRGYDLFVFMATDILREGTELFVVGETAFAETAFEVDFGSGSAWLDGVLSRKKQVAAALMDA